MIVIVILSLSIPSFWTRKMAPKYGANGTVTGYKPMNYVVGGEISCTCYLFNYWMQGIVMLVGFLIHRKKTFWGLPNVLMFVFTISLIVALRRRIKDVEGFVEPEEAQERSSSADRTTRVLIAILIVLIITQLPSCEFSRGKYCRCRHDSLCVFL